MGYITTYELRIIEGDPELIAEFRNECDAAAYAIDDEGNCNESCK